MSEQQQWVESNNGIRLFVTTWGNQKNTPIILVHGYPDSHTVWNNIAEILAKDFYVIAYDVRGAGQSSVPKKIKDYHLDYLAQDLAAVADTVIPNRAFHLAAHDWGSIQSWESVTTPRLQGRILSYTTLSGPSLDHAISTLYGQMLKQPTKALGTLTKSWYIALFQLPLLAPLAWKTFLGKNWSKVVDKLQSSKDLPENPTQTSDGVQGVNLYRANFIPRLIKQRERIAHCPVQVVVLEKDAFVSEFYFSELGKWVKDLSFNRIADNHWALLSKPEQVAAYIGDFAKQKTPQ